MDKSLFTFLVAGVGFFYLITHFVGNIQKEDEHFQSSEYERKHRYDSYKMTDSIGRDILNVTDADTQTQIAAWNEGNLKEEFLELYPDFSLMKDFVNNRVRGEPIKTKLLKLIDETESKFFSGEYSAEQAQAALKKLK
jgi:hypothetical protein